MLCRAHDKVLSTGSWCVSYQPLTLHSCAPVVSIPGCSLPPCIPALTLPVLTTDLACPHQCDPTCCRPLVTCFRADCRPLPPPPVARSAHTARLPVLPLQRSRALFPSAS